MSANLDYRIVVNLLTSSPPVSSSAFDTILYLSAGATFAPPTKVRTYNTTTAIDADSDLSAPCKAFAKQLFAQSVNPGKIKIGEAGIAANYGADFLLDLADDPDFYGVVTDVRTDVPIQSLAAQVQTAKKLFVCQTGQADVKNGVAGNTLKDLMAAGYTRTVLLFHETDTEAGDLAWAAYKLSCNPDERSTSWGNCHLTGIAADTLTDANRVQLVDTDDGNVYLEFFKVACTSKGQTCGGTWVDTVVSGDWAVARIQEAIAQLLLDASAQNTKIPYDDAGIGQIAGLVRKVLLRGESIGHFLKGSSKVTAPKLADIASATVSARTLTIQAQTTLCQAIDQTVTVSLVVNEA